MLDFWSFVNERHAIYLKRQAGAQPPWTEHRALQENYFCNVFRELDTTTIWYAGNIRKPLENRQEIFMATVIFRWFNFIETGRTLLEHGLLTDWSSKRAQDALRGRIKYVTGAYMIKTPTGMDKLHGVCWAIDQMWPQRKALFAQMNGQSLEAAWRVLLPFPFMGPFMAYEVITDLRHTYMLREAPDIMSWANIGPGARRGLDAIAAEGCSPDKLGLDYMKFLLSQSTDKRVWHYAKDWPMEMRDIEHAECEYSKYRRACNGERLKRKYHGTAREKR
jgi:hypothetical protein